MATRGILEKYRSLIGLPEHAVPLSLCEGDTPLIPVPEIARALGADCTLYVKFEGLNPTGSFKDRGMVAAVSEAVGRGAQSIICASTGNTSAAAAAYATRSGVRAIVIIPDGKVARGKLAAAAMYGARIIQIDGSFDDALTLVRTIAEELPIALVNSVNQYRLEGQKTAAFEICDDLGHAPDMLFIPVGNAGNITAYHMGFEQYKKGMPQFVGVQAAGAAPLVLGHRVDHPETVATAIRIGNPARGEQALHVVQSTAGAMISVTDNDILSAQKMLAASGIWVEPASAASLAGFKQEVAAGRDVRGKSVVVVCTGNGLKDPDIVDLPTPQKVSPTMEAVRELLS